jgi:phytoene synthase
MSEQTPQSALYDSVAEATASMIIRRYSTSFSLASRLLGPNVRQDVENIYGLVRLADEIVDGVAAEAGVTKTGISTMLFELERETEHAMLLGYSTNLVVHAFALTARRTGITQELTRPFFASMRMDITKTVHTQRSFDEYVYGSAVVVGLMCLRAFLRDAPVTEEQDRRFVHGARKLGAAFQKVNFLRDLSADVDALGRNYFPGVNFDDFSEIDKAALVTDISQDLAVSAAIVPQLPQSSRRAVALAQNLFAELNKRIALTPASELKHTRVSVPTLVKARLALFAWMGKLT